MFNPHVWFVAQKKKKKVQLIFKLSITIHFSKFFFFFALKKKLWTKKSENIITHVGTYSSTKNCPVYNLSNPHSPPIPLTHPPALEFKMGITHVQVGFKFEMRISEYSYNYHFLIPSKHYISIYLEYALQTNASEIFHFDYTNKFMFV